MIATLCFPKKSNTVYLAMKKRGFGAGYLNGWGGKAYDGEDIALAACREFDEEGKLKINPEDLELVAIVYFYEEEKLVFECHVFFLKNWSGEISETEEMGPAQSFDCDAIPFDQMWKSDRIWLPLIFEGKKIHAKAVYKAGMEEVRSFEYQLL